MTTALSPQTEAMIARLLARFAPPVRVGLTEWAEEHVFLAQGTKRTGPYRVAVTPYLRGIQAEVTYALTGVAPTPRINGRPVEVCVQKAAQQGYTVGVLCMAIAYVIASLRLPQLTLFAKDNAAREFATEKFQPLVESTPCLADIVDITSRARGESMLHRSYPGGFAKFVGSRSPSNVKSSSVPFVAVEEPDDTERDVRGQGDSIELALERMKGYLPDACLLVGGTPTVKGLSVVEARVLRSDQRHYHVPCHECGKAAPLRWEQVTHADDEHGEIRDPVYGVALPDTAVYVCPHCTAPWDDAARIANVARADAMQQAGEPAVGWVPHAAFDGRAGFYLNELLSSFEASRLRHLVRKYLLARHEHEQGKPEKLISFTNNTLGLPWEHKDDTPAAEALEARGEPYAFGTVPHGGCVVVAGIDVQHTWLHVHLWAVGRDEESWLVGRHLIPAENTKDKADPAWQACTELLARPLRHASGASLYVAAFTLDTSDGGTQDAGYHYVRGWRGRRQPNGQRVVAMAGKGAGERGPDGRRTAGGQASADREIYTAPRKVDIKGNDKASRYGLKLYIIGVNRAKDSLAARLRLTGTGPGRLHWPADTPPEFFAGITAEIKVPGRAGRLEWKVKAGQRNEDTDCAVYAQHAWRALRVHFWTEAQWRDIEVRLQQFERDLVAQAEAPADDTDTADDAPAPPATTTPPPTARRAPRRKGGWMGSYRR